MASAKTFNSVINKAQRITVMKSDDERRLVFGWASVAVRVTGEEIVDWQEDIIEIGELEKAAYEYTAEFGTAGEMHERGGVGRLVESVVFTKEKAAAMGIPAEVMPEDAAAFAEFEKKYGTIADAPEAGDLIEDSAVLKVGEIEIPPELHPEVKKALDGNKALAAQVEELRKSLEIKDLTALAKKYEILGKNPEDLAPKLYDLKKAGGTAYDDYVALLDEQTTLVEKGGLFGEIGKNTSGGISAGSELNVKAAEIKKANTGMSDAEAFAKAYETYPELAAQYEQTYRGRA